MNCPRCNTPMRMQVQATISAPSSMLHKLSKRNLRNQSVYLMSVNWNTADHVCTNPNCGHFIGGFGNYILRLEKRIEELEAKP